MLLAFTIITFLKYEPDLTSPSSKIFTATASAYIPNLRRALKALDKMDLLHLFFYNVPAEDTDGTC